MDLQERCEVDKENALKFERDCRCLKTIFQKSKQILNKNFKKIDKFL